MRKKRCFFDVKVSLDESNFKAFHESSRRKTFSRLIFARVSLRKRENFAGDTKRFANEKR